MNTQEIVSVNDGKYSVVMYSDGNLKTLRYGEPWQDLTGNNLVYWLAVELRAVREAIEFANNYQKEGNK